ncbi:MAG: 3-dehydroquinate synthase, partial [Sphingomonadaceae bacterium]|nr:3-dehydroquinate synthase [Sphingomonadaceae bacterium]
DFCADNLDSFFAGSPDIRAQAIIRSVQSKARIVAADETERTGTRALLNLGHTFGHALEADTGFSDRLFHGEAVAAGMALAFRYSVRLGLCPAEDAERVSTLLNRAGLPTTLSEAGVSSNGGALVDYMRHDKKMSGGTLPFLLARGIGQTFLSKEVSLDDVAAFLDSEV